MEFCQERPDECGLLGVENALSAGLLEFDIGLVAGVGGTCSDLLEELLGGGVREVEDAGDLLDGRGVWAVVLDDEGVDDVVGDVLPRLSRSLSLGCLGNGGKGRDGRDCQGLGQGLEGGGIQG